MKQIIIFITLSMAQCSLHSQNKDIYVVHINELKSEVQPTMWGLFFEDINRSADGGIYAELVKNRSFDFPDAFMGWQTTPPRYAYAKNDIFQIINQSATNGNDPKYLQVTISNPSNFSISNEGFGGITVRKVAEYNFTLVYRVKQPGLKLSVSINNFLGQPVGNTTIDLPSASATNAWQTFDTTIKTNDTTQNGKLLITFQGAGQMDIDRISLFPTNTWKNEKGGLRNDLVQKLCDLKPGFVRFPGGCLVEGQDIATRYQWKKTIGPLEDRKLLFNDWNNAIPNRPLPDYFQSYGVGFLEYFKLCEDLKASPMPILNCGLSCQFGAGEVVPIDQVNEYIQDALDLIEFANGDASTKWGARRVALGHFEPFNMKLLGVGNENWGPQYLERLQLFTNAVKEKYPYMQIICATGYSPNPQFHYMDSALRAMHVDIIDEHYYQKPNWFLMNAGKYDNYDRKGPKIFIGEYAAQSVRIGSIDNKNNLLCALSEAAFMTGLERNADVVTMAAYAPLFAHVNDWQWTPNLIWFDNNSSFATPSYYVQQLFSNNKGTDVVSMTQQSETIKGQDSVWASAVIDTRKNEIIIKLVNPSSQIKLKTISIPELKRANLKAIMVELRGSPNDQNSFNNEPIVPVTKLVETSNRELKLEIAPWSFLVIKIKE